MIKRKQAVEAFHNGTRLRESIVPTIRCDGVWRPSPRVQPRNTESVSHKIDSSAATSTASNSVGRGGREREKRRSERFLPWESNGRPNRYMKHPTLARAKTMGNRPNLSK
ncbi:hypothetical protein Taro_017113, partial [Colocasia esculenta]|nr:hypothetical protein [Colocasia esculenta]